MLSTRSCSPQVIQIFVPVSFQWSPSATPFVVINPRSVPHCGSVRHIVAIHSPLTSFRR